MTRQRRRLNQDGAPAVNNTTEVLLMGAIAITQVVLFALSGAKVQSLAIFDNTEFLLLTRSRLKTADRAGPAGRGQIHPSRPTCAPLEVSQRGDQIELEFEGCFVDFPK